MLAAVALRPLNGLPPFNAALVLAGYEKFPRPGLTGAAAPETGAMFGEPESLMLLLEGNGGLFLEAPLLVWSDCTGSCDLRR